MSRKKITNEFVKKLADNRIFIPNSELLKYSYADYYQCDKWTYTVYLRFFNTLFITGRKVPKELITHTANNDKCIKYAKIADLLYKKYHKINEFKFNRLYFRLLVRIYKDTFKKQEKFFIIKSIGA